MLQLPPQSQNRAGTGHCVSLQRDRTHHRLCGVHDWMVPALEQGKEEK